MSQDQYKRNFNRCAESAQVRSEALTIDRPRAVPDFEASATDIHQNNEPGEVSANLGHISGAFFVDRH